MLHLFVLTLGQRATAGTVARRRQPVPAGCGRLDGMDVAAPALLGIHRELLAGEGPLLLLRVEGIGRLRLHVHPDAPEQLARDLGSLLRSSWGPTVQISTITLACTGRSALSEADQAVADVVRRVVDIVQSVKDRARSIPEVEREVTLRALVIQLGLDRSAELASWLQTDITFLAGHHGPADRRQYIVQPRPSLRLERALDRAEPGHISWLI